MSHQHLDPVLDQRRAGVLLHPTSLPGKLRHGDIGLEARNFMHFIADAGFSVWQMLPIGAPHQDGSPYQCLSAHAGNPELICLDWLIEQQWLTPAETGQLDSESSKISLLQIASERFFELSSADWLSRFHGFVDQNSYWLADYALFMVLRETHNHKAWMDWPTPLKLRDEKSLHQASQTYAKSIRTIQFIQFVFFTQWAELRAYAKTLDIKLFGDMPIFVAMDSADVWSRKDNFLINSTGQCEWVAGVPPDAFSDDGQLWGNPLFNWNTMKKQGFDWWISRFKTQLNLFDYIRIDHFRGLEACWHIPADAKTAKHGNWILSPGNELLRSLYDYFHQLPLIAEDLGYITEPVRQLRDKFQLPGMVVLQFAFGGDSDNPYLPHNHPHNSVVYTGTHDNDTTLGWYQHLDPDTKSHCHAYLGQSEHNEMDMPWELNRVALASVARLAILPMQDLLSLDSAHRMNMPGTIENNWQWRFNWSQLQPDLSHNLSGMIKLYGRLP